jgi:hypothetical protein
MYINFSQFNGMYDPTMLSQRSILAKLIYIYIYYIHIYILYIYIYYKRLWEQSLTTGVVVRSPSLFSQASHPSTEGSVASRVHPAARGGGWDHLLPQSSAFQWQVYRPTKKKSHYRNLEENGGHIIYTYLHHPANHLSTLFFGGRYIHFTHTNRCLVKGATGQ